MNKFIPEIAKHFNKIDLHLYLVILIKHVIYKLNINYRSACVSQNWYPVNTTINTCCAKPKSSSRHFGKYDNILYRKASLVSGTFGTYSSNPNVILQLLDVGICKTSDHLPIAARFRI